MKGNKFLLKVCAGVISTALIFSDGAIMTFASESTEISSETIEIQTEEENDDAIVIDGNAQQAMNESDIPEVVESDINAYTTSLEEVKNAPVLGTEWKLHSLPNAQDHVWYKFKLDKPGYIQVEARMASGADENKLKLGWRLETFSNDDLEHAITSGNVMKQSYTTPIISVGTNEIYISVKANTPYDENAPINQPFEIRLSYVNGDTWETEFNDTIGSASVIKENETYFGNLYSYKDVDYYKFVMPDTGYFYVDFKMDQALCDIEKVKLAWNVTLLNSKGEEIYKKEGVKTHNGIEQPYEKGEEFYVVVEARYKDSMNSPMYQVYDLSAVFTKTNPDEYETEPNNTIENADAMVLNKVMNGFVNTTKDKDYYKFNVPSKQDVEINFEINKPEGTVEYAYLKLFVYDSTGKTVKEFNQVCKGETYKFEGDAAKISLAKGDYYFMIDGYANGYETNMKGAEYKLKLVSTAAMDEPVSAEKYTVSYNGLEGVTFDATKLVTSYDWSKKMKPIKLLTKKDLVKKGYTFKGWRIKDNNKKATKITKKTVNGTTFVAQWAENTYTIKYYVPKKVNGKKVLGRKVDSLKNIPYTRTESLNNGSGISVEGATFKGWTSVKGSTTVEFKPGQSVSGLTDKHKKVVKLYAVFQ